MYIMSCQIAYIHSDQGSQVCMNRVSEAAKKRKTKQSMSQTDDSYDNAFMEL